MDSNSFNILHESPKVRALALFFGLKDSILNGLNQPKRYFAEKLFDLLMDGFEDKIQSVTDEQVIEWAQKTRQISDVLYTVVETGKEIPPELMEGITAMIGAGDDGKTDNHE